jgi:hypothetical protein
MWYAKTYMKTIRPLLPCLCALALAGCSNTNNPGSILMTPFTMMGGLLKAVGRTVTQNEAAPTSEAAIAARGATIENRGTYRGNANTSKSSKPVENIAQRMR